MWEGYERRRREERRALVGSLALWLRDGLDVESATDIFSGVFSHAPMDVRLNHRGWTLVRYADFLVDAVHRLLLQSLERAPAHAPPTRPGRVPQFS